MVLVLDNNPWIVREDELQWHHHSAQVLLIPHVIVPDQESMPRKRWHGTWMMIVRLSPEDIKCQYIRAVCSSCPGTACLSS